MTLLPQGHPRNFLKNHFFTIPKIRVETNRRIAIKSTLAHARGGDVVLISQPDQWFAYYWWLDDGKAPAFARTVDIHRKPGYDPVELFIDMPARTIPLQTSLVKGSHGFPADEPSRRGVLVCSTTTGVRPQADGAIADTQISSIILRNFGVSQTSS